MKGDIINIEPHHYKIAKKIITRIRDEIRDYNGIYSISVGGESGCGKSETASAIYEELCRHNFQSLILQQDDYFKLPPKSNDRKRRLDFNWIGPDEVGLDLLEEHIKQIKSGAQSVTKPLVIFDEDLISKEIISVSNIKVIIVEGTYTSLLNNIDHKVFISSSNVDTLNTREKRARAAHELDDFANRVLEKEHKIISKHKSIANTIISSRYEVEFIT